VLLKLIENGQAETEPDSDNPIIIAFLHKIYPSDVSEQATRACERWQLTDEHIHNELPWLLCGDIVSPSLQIIFTDRVYKHLVLFRSFIYRSPALYRSRSHCFLLALDQAFNTLNHFIDNSIPLPLYGGMQYMLQSLWSYLSFHRTQLQNRLLLLVISTWSINLTCHPSLLLSNIDKSTIMCNHNNNNNIVREKGCFVQQQHSTNECHAIVIKHPQQCN
jgi:hypothetical protein